MSICCMEREKDRTRERGREGEGGRKKDREREGKKEINRSTYYEPNSYLRQVYTLEATFI